MEAIVYTSRTGSTQRYARLLSQEMHLPAYALTDAKRTLAPGRGVLYLGWIKAGRIEGYGAARRRFALRGVCAVGMSPTGTQTLQIRRTNRIPAQIPLFTLQGGFDPDALRGLSRLVMGLIRKAAQRDAAQGKAQTKEAAEMLALLLEGGDRVSRENLEAVLDWYRSETVPETQEETP